MAYSDFDAPFICERVHVLYRTKKQRKRRWKLVGKWMARSRLPKRRPKWLSEVIYNHGGGGGP